MTHIIHVPVPVLLIVFIFERQDHEQSIDALLHLFNPVGFPGPDLRRDVVNNFITGALGPLSDAQIETGIIDEDDHIGVERFDVGLTKSKIAQDGGKVAKHFEKSHEREIAKMLHQSSAFGLHAIASPAMDLGEWILLTKRTDEVAAMQVARCFAGDEIIFQKIS